MVKATDLYYPLNWHNKIESATIDSLENNIVLLENPSYNIALHNPVKIDSVISVLCVTGIMQGTLNLKQFTAKAPGMFIVQAEQILQCDYLSEDYSGLSIIMSKQFLENLFDDVQVSMQLFRSVNDNPWTSLSDQEMDSMLEFFHLMQKTIRNKENPNRKETVKHLTLSFFYGSGYRFHRMKDDSVKSKKDVLVDKFLNLAKAYYRKHRDIEYYADRLFLTPKYLSKVIKIKSGKSAGEWIEDLVILEARALLSSTRMTVGQISEELNFPTQSFFGKYFKRRVGLSPKQYKKKLLNQHI